MVAVEIEEKTPEDRIKDIERELHGSGEDGAAPGLLELLNGSDKRVGMFAVLNSHEKRLQKLEPPTGQPRDWFLVDKPETAAQWLDELDQWYDRVLKHVKPGLVAKAGPDGETQADPPCWRWHPAVVAKLIVLQGLWMAARRPADAASLWERDLGVLTGKIDEELRQCKQAGRHRGHDCGHVQKQPDNTVISDWIVDVNADQDRLRGDYIDWWCGAREGIPPGLMPA